MNNANPTLIKQITEWLESNRAYLSKSSVKESEFEVIVSAIPKASSSSSVSLMISKVSSHVVVSAGTYLCISDYQYSSTNELIEILEAIKAGKIEEEISSFFGVTTSTAGKVLSTNGTLYSKEIRVFGLISSFLPQKKVPLLYAPWDSLRT